MVRPTAIVWTVQPSPEGMVRITMLRSSNVKALEYIEVTRQLTVCFQSGRYVYEGVPYTTWRALLEAQSMGKAVNSLVVKHDPPFPYRKLAPDEYIVPPRKVDAD